MCVWEKVIQRQQKGKREESDILQTGRDKKGLNFCPATKCPNSLFAASAPPLRATSKINGDHYHSHASQTLLVQPSRSSLTPAPQTLYSVAVKRSMLSHMVQKCPDSHQLTEVKKTQKAWAVVWGGK